MRNMKTIKNFSAFFVMLVMSLCMLSCSSEDENLDTNVLANTVWQYSDIYEDGSVIQELNFNSDYTATYTITLKNQGGIIVDTDLSYYTYQVSENLVVLTSQQSGIANLEGTITAGVKMQIVNMSSNEEIGVFYKK